VSVVNLRLAHTISTEQEPKTLMIPLKTMKLAEHTHTRTHALLARYSRQFGKREVFVLFGHQERVLESSLGEG
jgi:hypothetical protein